MKSTECNIQSIGNGVEWDYPTIRQNRGFATFEYYNSSFYTGCGKAVKVYHILVCFLHLDIMRL